MSSKQLSILLGIIVAVLLGVVGYIALKDDSQSDTLSQQNSTPNSILVDSNANTAQPVNTPPPANSGITQLKSFAYTNPDYGFRLTLNQNWEGYKVFKGTNPREVYYKFCVKTSAKLSLADQPTVSEGYACPFMIFVYSESFWKSLDPVDQQRLNDSLVGMKNGNRFFMQPWQDPPADLMNVDFGWESIKKSFSI